MSIVDIRFRQEDDKLILQIAEKQNDRYYSDNERIDWRDAGVQDLLNVADLLRAKYTAMQPASNVIE